MKKGLTFLSTLCLFGSPTRTRTRDQLINSQSLYQLSYRGILSSPCADAFGCGRDFGIAPVRSQATRTRFILLIASSNVLSEHANDKRI